jgi:hypothetical protein
MSKQVPRGEEGSSESVSEKDASVTSASNLDIGMGSIGDGIDTILNNVQVKPSIGAGTGIASEQEIDTTMKTILINKKIPLNQENFNKTVVTVCHMVQEGATSPKYAESKMVPNYGLYFKVGDLRAACKSSGITVRKLARGLKDEIIKIAARYDIEGNLAKNYKLDNPQFDPQDLIWVSDFQTFSENPAMPQKVKEWLLDNYRNRFRTSIKEPNS